MLLRIMSPVLLFKKFQGLGNDFIVVDARSSNALMSKATAVRLCDRRRGVGADGVLTVLRPEGEADVRMHIYNADGSVPEMCGNGLRCVVRACAEPKAPNALRVETGAGTLEGWLSPEGDVRVTLGAGRVLHPALPAQVGGTLVHGVEVDIGNPHLVLFMDGPEWQDRTLAALADTYGPELEVHPRFPERVNVGFARVTPGASSIELVVFERGVGRTLACGTGAAASAWAARATRRITTHTVEVRLPGGTVRIELSTGAGEPTYLTGAAEEVFRGEFTL